MKTLNRQAQAAGYIVPFNVFFLFFMISYGKIVSQTPGHPAEVVCSTPNYDMDKLLDAESFGFIFC